MIIARFHVPINLCDGDPRPIKVPLPHPYWWTGSSEDDLVIVAYADNEAQVLEYWPEAEQIDSKEVSKYSFTDRFPKPDWFDKQEVQPDYSISNEHMELIAEKCKWHPYDMFQDGTAQRFIDERRSWIRAGRDKEGGRWDLTEAGMMAVISDYKLCLEWSLDGLDVRVMSTSGKVQTRDEELRVAVQLAISTILNLS